jgi:hypothetical protein
MQDRVCGFLGLKDEEVAQTSGLVVFVAVMTLLLVILTACYFHDSILERRFQRVTEGMSEPEVLSVLGKPSRIEPCRGVVGYPHHCSREYLYFGYMPSITSWGVRLNERGAVVGKYRYESP